MLASLSPCANILADESLAGMKDKGKIKVPSSAACGALLEAGTSFLSNGVVPAKTSGLVAKDATESGYIWGVPSGGATGMSEGAQVHLGVPQVRLGVLQVCLKVHRYIWGYPWRYQSLGCPLKERWEKAALRGKWFGPPARSPKCLIILKRLLPDSANVQLPTWNAQNKGLIQECFCWFFLKQLFSSTLNSPPFNAAMATNAA